MIRIHECEAFVCDECGGTGGDSPVCPRCEGYGQIDTCRCGNCGGTLFRGTNHVWLVRGIHCCVQCAVAILEVTIGKGRTAQRGSSRDS